MGRFLPRFVFAPAFPVLMSGAGGDAVPLHISLNESEEAATSPSPQEEQLLAIFKEMRLPLLRYLLSLRVPPEQAEEIVQEAFVRLFTHLRDRRIRENAQGWLFRVAHNLALKWKQTRRGRGDACILDLAEEGPVDPALSPEDLLLLSERDRRLVELVASLPEQEQNCLHLRAEGLRYREIAQALCLGVTTVADSLRRAIRLLQEGLR